ncbi:MAG: long-chain acyl-CoA synthetase [Flavobacterium sp.]|jgi:long-chain acyl-CoA synthetase
MLSMTQLINRASQTQGELIATSYFDQVLGKLREQTWIQYQHKIACFASGLHELGVVNDDTVAILALNSDRYFEFMFAVPWAGAVFQPINTRLAGPELTFWLNDSEAKVLFVDSAFVQIVNEIRSELNHIESIVFLDDGDTPEGYLSYHSIVSSDPIADSNRHGDDLAGLFYTGGTTGRSKGVKLSHTNLVINAMQTVPLIDCQEKDRILHIAPMFHIADAFICMSSVITCGSNYFLPAFDPSALMKIVQASKIERMLLVPTMVNILVNHPDIGDYDLKSIRGIVYGASPMPEPVIKKAMSVMPQTHFYQAYGQTEAAPVITILSAERHVFEGPLSGKMKSAGQAVPGVDLVIMDDDGKVAGTDEVGEICMRGPNVMLGYRNLADQTAATIVDGWLHTGDGGYLDKDGFLSIVDRVKDMIISGGENVYSAEVEASIYQHHGVNQCAVIGIPSEKWGEAVHAIVVLHEDAVIGEKALIAHCKKLIAGFKCPQSVSFRSEPLPLSGAGKILKTELRLPFWAGKNKNVS